MRKTKAFGFLSRVLPLFVFAALSWGSVAEAAPASRQHEGDQAYCALTYRALTWGMLPGGIGWTWVGAPGVNLYLVPAGEFYSDYFDLQKNVTDANGYAAYTYRPGEHRTGYYQAWLIDFYPGTRVIRQIAWGPSFYFDGACSRPAPQSFVIWPV